MELLKMLSASEVVAQLISFLVLFFLLKIFAWKPMLKLLDQRRDTIAAELKRAEDRKREAENTKAEFDQKLKGIEDIARTRIQDMMADAEKGAQAVKDDAQREAARIILKAEDDTKYEAMKAKEAIRDEIANLVLEATGMLLEEKVDEEQDKKLVKEFLEKVDKA